MGDSYPRPVARETSANGECAGGSESGFSGKRCVLVLQVNVYCCHLWLNGFVEGAAGNIYTSRQNKAVWYLRRYTNGQKVSVTQTAWQLSEETYPVRGRSSYSSHFPI